MFRILALCISLGFCLVVLPPQASAEEVKIKHKGLALNADLTLAPGKKLSDGVVLMTHGDMAHKGMEIMVLLRDKLAEKGLSTLSINLSLAEDDRHGMKDCAGPQRHIDSNAMVEIAQWVAWLKGKGAGPITVLGHSRGANQTSRYVAAGADPLVKNAVLVAPAIWDPGKPVRRFKQRFKKDLGPVMDKAKALVQAGKGGALMKGVDFAFCPNSTAAAATFADYYGANPDFDTPSVIARIKMPVLIVTGSADRVNPGMPEKMKGRTGANVTLVEVDGAGHFFRDLFGEDLADAVAEFIAKGAGS
ncbi:MAG: alpha/beta hydrolase [Rhodospirillales bacterium]|nr:alpha/beta hydrolase [Rhodospirillales bacterium]